MVLGAVPVFEQLPQVLPTALGTFPSDFTWGVATSSYQIEGAATADGRLPSIWDTFCHTPGNVLNGDTGDEACDHYHRWRQDIGLMRELGVGAYRFSIAWPRIIPSGTGAVNTLGLDWYDRLVDALLEAGIQPWITLYHWDLPQPLEDAGGWPARATADAFAEFTAVVARRLGNRVPRWSTLNEPWCSAFLGYLLGVHAPGKRDPRLALAAAHTLLVAHGRAVDILRTHSPGARIGIVLDLTTTEPASQSEADVAAAQRADGYQNRWFLDPLFGRGYPTDMLSLVERFFDAPSDEDMRAIAAPIDYLGVNYYRPSIVRANPGDGFLEFAGLAETAEPVTQMGWIVRPSGLSDLLRRIYRDYGVSELAVTENGAAYLDPTVIDGRVHDPQRT